MESKLVISCRMMHNLIKKIPFVQELCVFSLSDYGRTRTAGRAIHHR